MITTTGGQSPKLLLALVKYLEKSGAPYAVIGALATSYHGTYRTTSDADAAIFVRPETFREMKVLEAWRGLGLQIEERRGAPDDPIPLVVFIKDSFGNRVDLLFGLKGMDAEALGRTIRTPILGQEISMIGLEDLIVMKIEAGGPKDFEDVRNVIAVSREKIDIELLKTISRRFGNGNLKSLKTLLQDSP